MKKRGDPFGSPRLFYMVGLFQFKYFFRSKSHTDHRFAYVSAQYQRKAFDRQHHTLEAFQDLIAELFSALLILGMDHLDP